MVLAVDDGLAAFLALYPMAGEPSGGIVVESGVEVAQGADGFLPLAVALQLGEAVAVVIQGGELPEGIVFIGQLLAAGQQAADAVAQGIVAVFDFSLILGFGLQLAVGGISKRKRTLAVACAGQAAILVISEDGVANCSCLIDLVSSSNTNN